MTTLIGQSGRPMNLSHMADLSHMTAMLNHQSKLALKFFSVRLDGQNVLFSCKIVAV